MKKTIQLLLFHTFVIGLLFLVGYLYYLLFFPFFPAEIKTPKTGFKVVNQKVTPGDTLHVDVTYCNYLNYPTDIKFSIISYKNDLNRLVSRIYPNLSIPSPTSRIPSAVSQCVRILDLSYSIPSDFPAGEYYPTISIESYTPFPFREPIKKSYEGEKFTVEKGGE